MNIWLILLIVIGGFILLSVLLGLIREIIYLVRESHDIKMYNSRTDRLDLLSNIYSTASNTYITFAQKGIALADYAYLAEVAIYGLIKELGGDTTTLLQKIQQFMNKPKGSQSSGKNIIIIPGPKPQGPKEPKKSKTINTDDSKKTKTEKDIDEILDKWEKEHPNWRDKDKKDKDGLSE